MMQVGLWRLSLNPLQRVILSIVDLLAAVEGREIMAAFRLFGCFFFHAPERQAFRHD